jgi:hypothetical protein
MLFLKPAAVAALVREKSRSAVPGVAPNQVSTMSGDYYSLREIGVSQLAQHYPDQGLIANANWYDAILSIETDAVGMSGAVRSLAIPTHRFGVVLSANAAGLRIFSPLDRFAVFIPWAEATVTAERGVRATVVRVRASAVPSLALVFHLDDSAADDLFRAVIAPLPRRNPPHGLFRFKPWALGALVIALLAVAGYLASLQLSPLTLVVAILVAAVALWLVPVALQPVIEEPR